VEIVTSQKQKPNEDWLKVAISSRALGKIRAFLRHEERLKAVEKGKEIVAKEVKRVGRKLDDLLKTDEVHEWMRKNGLHGVEDVYAAEGLGQHSLRSLLERLGPAEASAASKAAQSKAAAQKPVPAKAPAKAPARKGAPSSSGVVVQGLDKLMTRFAKCCSPAPGDALAGIVTRGRGVSVHRRDCATLARYANDSGRQVLVEWADEAARERLVTIAIRTSSSMTRLVELVSLIEQEDGLTIASGRIASRQGVYTQHLTIRVRDAKRLERMLQRLNAMAGVRAERVLESA
jgi:guanosine-3',5'-bis(diphosphate) 3'-pyrophosphohydrolase